MKAVLLSAFVFPGAGHLLLKQYIPATVLAGTALAGLYYLIAKTVEKALRIAEEIQSGEVQLDATTITELVARQTTGTDGQLLDFALAVFLISWLIGIIDSYRVGRTQDKHLAAGD
jgi:hypothetical protein